MLVDINLLPHDERKKSSWLKAVIAIATLGLVLILTFAILGIYQGKAVDTLASQLSQEQKLRAQKEEKIAELESMDTWANLDAAVKWAEGYPMPMLPVLGEVVDALPERGFLEEFTYTGAGALELGIQFDSSREAAYYLERISSTELVSDVKLLGVETEALEEGEAAADGVLPRYLARYALTLDREAVKGTADEEEEGE
ncbi:type IV pilus assembly protein PilN [Rossellomorea marisflavi]